MRHFFPRSCTIALCLIAVMGSITISAPAQTKAASAAWLYLQQPPVERPNRDAAYSLLGREILRQGLLIAARDQIGAATRDAVLREPKPAGQAGISLANRAQIYGGHMPVMTITLPSLGKWGWQKNAFLKPGPDQLIPYRQEVKTVEQWSRRSFVDLLKSLGLQGTPMPLASHGPVTPRVRDLLPHMNELAQYMAARLIWLDMRRHGESPERLSALVRAYANLGQLTWYQCSAASQVFYARSLLYAQRNIALHGKTTTTLRAQAYALAMVGLQRDALDDIPTAAKLKGTAPPAWLNIIDDYCRYDTAGLKQISDNSGRWTDLALYLRFNIGEQVLNNRIEYPVAHDLLEIDPACMRVREALAMNTMRAYYDVKQGLYIKPDHPFGSPHVFDNYLRTFLTQAPAIPAAAKAAATKIQPNIFPAPNMPSVVTALQNAGAPQLDHAEPAWTTLATLIQSTNFVEVYWRLTKTDNHPLTPQTIQRAIQSTKGHPYHALISAPLKPGADPRHPAVKVLIRDANYADYELTKGPGNYYNDVGNYVIPYINTKAFNPKGDLDQTSTDLNLLMALMQVQSVSTAEQVHTLAPDSPYAMGLLIKWRYNQVKNELPQFEKHHPDSFRFWGFLGVHYDKTKQWQKALDAWQHCARITRSYNSYNRVANDLIKLGHDQKAIDCLKHFLRDGTADVKWDIALANHSIARAYINFGRYQQALPYVKKTIPFAQNPSAYRNPGYGGWGDTVGARDMLIDASQVQVALHHWQRAEKRFVTGVFIDADGEDDFAYSNFPCPLLRRYLWCIRTQHGHKFAARQAFVDTVSEGKLYYAAQNRLMFNLAGGNMKKAYAIAKKQFQNNTAPRNGLCLAIMAYKRGDTALCNKVLTQLRNNPGENSSSKWDDEEAAIYKQLARALTPFLTGYGRPNLPGIDATIAKIRWDRRIPYNFYIGWTLDVVGRSKQAVKYYKRCITPLYTPVSERTLAFVHLREHHIDPLAVLAQRARKNAPADLRSPEHSDASQPSAKAASRK